MAAAKRKMPGETESRLLEANMRPAIWAVMYAVPTISEETQRASVKNLGYGFIQNFIADASWIMKRALETSPLPWRLPVRK